MFRCVNLLMLFYFVNYSGTAPVGNTLISVMGKRGGSVILPCEFEARGISDIVLSKWSKNILVCENEECKSGRVFKKGSCDVILMDLIFSDAGKYILRLYYNNDQRELERLIRKYQLHIQDEISVKTGEQLKMDVLLINAEKVEKNSSGEWTEVWTRGHGVSSDRLTDSNGKLTISNFTVSDTGTYRVLDSEGEILITVTVTESGTDFNRKLDTDDIKPYDTEQFTVGHWILSVGMVVYVVLLTLVLIILVIRKHQFRNKKVDHDSSQGIPLQSVVHEAQIT
ncbi:uncharacterized protein LOC125262051 [Megalobrama amblycephala]|uniref:uncharacterized protein LOC125262051 n=1 Tax=Megalobrama amblycephala TaxID=75352 RepID=UPI00201461DF|nr:uncharacterized protein LOC125262051 [Megalobrama amblycephala]